MISIALTRSSMASGMSALPGLVRASQVAMAPYSVRREPSSRISTGTFIFGLMALKASPRFSWPSTSTSSRVNGRPISSSSTWMPMAQVCLPQ